MTLSDYVSQAMHQCPHFRKSSQLFQHNLLDTHACEQSRRAQFAKRGRKPGVVLLGRRCNRLFQDNYCQQLKLAGLSTALPSLGRLRTTTCTARRHSRC